MGYIGEEGRVVSSNYLFNMLQDLYTKIKGLLSNKADSNHTHNYAGSSSVGGSANSAVKLETPRKIELSGGVTGTTTSFDGSSDITIPVTSILPSHIGDGYTTKSIYLNTHPENVPVVIPFINNDIAYLLKRGGSAVVTYDGVVQDIDISGIFDGSPSYCVINITNINEIAIELTLHKTFIWTNTIYVDMGANLWRAKNIKLEVMNSNYENDVWTTKAESLDRNNAQFKCIFQHAPVDTNDAGKGFNKVRVTFSNWNHVNSFRISAIGILNYSSGGLRETFLPKDGGLMYGTVNPYYDNKYDLGGSDLRWRSVHANKFYGSLSGRATDADNSDTLDGCHASEFQKAMDFPSINTNVLEYAENLPITHENGTFFTCRIYNGYNEPYADEVIGSGDYYYCINKIDSSWITILAIDVRSTNVFVRNKHSGIWGEWKSISNNGNTYISDGCCTIKGTITTLFTPTEEGTWYVSNGDDTFPYPYGLLEIRYGSYDKEYTVTYKTTGDDFKLYYNGWREESGGWMGWKDCVDCDNADTLDGIHADGFVKTSGRNTITADSDSSTYGRGVLTLENSTSGSTDIYPAISFCQTKISDANLCMKDREFYRKTSTDSNYYKIYDSGNLTSLPANGGNADTVDGYHADSFAKLSGAYFSGNVTIHSADLNGKYNGLLVGDDCYIGDCNIGNTIGLMGVSDNNIAYVKFGKNGKQLGFNGSNLVYDGSVVVTENTGTSSSTKGINSTGYGNGNLTYLQTSGDFNDNTGWCHYIIANHGSGESYYNYMIGLPFYTVPMYRRQTGNANAKTDWHKFYTTENITYGTSDLTAGSSSLAKGHIYLQYE